MACVILPFLIISVVRTLLILTVELLMEADVKMIVLISGCSWLISLLVATALDVQQISDSVLPSLEV